MGRTKWRERKSVTERERDTLEAAIFLTSPREIEREGWRKRNGERECVCVRERDTVEVGFFQLYLIENSLSRQSQNQNWNNFQGLP